jgi:uncharacterized protein YecE (DUF72 family)
LPSREQFAAWAEQTAQFQNFFFAVKASRYLTHMKKLKEPQEAIARLLNAAQGLGNKLGPFLYQLPPHWKANLERLREFLACLPADYQTAVEFRDPSWFQGATLQALKGILTTANCALVVAVGGMQPTPLDIPAIGPFRYYRFHNGKYGTGLSDDELAFWAGRMRADQEQGYEVFAYFNNDPQGYAIFNALKLQELLGV